MYQALSSLKMWWMSQVTKIHSFLVLNMNNNIKLRHVATITEGFIFREIGSIDNIAMSSNNCFRLPINSECNTVFYLVILNQKR